MSNSPTTKKVCLHPLRRARRGRALARRTRELEALLASQASGEPPSWRILPLEPEATARKIKIAETDIANLNRKGIAA